MDLFLLVLANTLPIQYKTLVVQILVNLYSNHFGEENIGEIWYCKADKQLILSSIRVF